MEEQRRSKNKRMICKGIDPNGKLQFMIEEEEPIEIKPPVLPEPPQLQPEEARDQENRREREHTMERSL